MPRPAAPMNRRAILRSALNDAIGWQLGLVDSYSHMQEDPQYAKAKMMLELYRQQLREMGESGRTPHDPEPRGKTITLMEAVGQALQKPSTNN